MKLSVHKYVGSYGDGLIFSVPGTNVDTFMSSPKDWILLGEYEMNEQFLRDCTTEYHKGEIWTNYYIE